MTDPCPDCHAARALCDDCRAVLTARAALTPRDQARDVAAFLGAWTTALESLTDHYLARAEQAEQDARDAATQAKARELDLLLVALRHDAPIPELASPALNTIATLWHRSLTYNLPRPHRWRLLLSAYPPARLLHPYLRQPPPFTP